MTLQAPWRRTGHFLVRSNTPASINRGRDRELLATDLMAFQQAGGTIEKLGNTRVLKYAPSLEAARPAPVRVPSKAKTGPN